MKILIPIVLVGIMATSVGSCQEPEVRKAMVQFDQAFVPVLIYAYEGDIYEAKRAVFFLEFQWQKLKGQYQGVLPEEKETFRRIDGWLGDAYYAIDGNSPFTAANQLEHVKYEFMALRQRYGVDYYLDGLYDFHSSISLLQEAAQDEMLCLLEWGEYEQLILAAQQEWKTIRERPFDAELHKFDAAALRQLQTEQQAMAEALNQFAQTAACANRTELAQASVALQPAFLKVLRLFGKFEASQTYFAQR